MSTGGEGRREGGREGGKRRKGLGRDSNLAEKSITTKGDEEAEWDSLGVIIIKWTSGWVRPEAPGGESTDDAFRWPDRIFFSLFFLPHRTCKSFSWLVDRDACRTEIEARNKAASVACVNAPRVPASEIARRFFSSFVFTGSWNFCDIKGKSFIRRKINPFDGWLKMTRVYDGHGNVMCEIL